MGISFDQYQESSRVTAIYPGSGTGTFDALAYVALGLGETGELQGKVKKIYRDNTRDDEAMIAELGDILWYVSQFATELGVSLSEVAERNLAKLLDRMERGALAGSGDTR